MNGPDPTPESRFGQLEARLAALQPAHVEATADLAQAEQAVAALLAAQRRPPRELRRQLQRERDRARSRHAAIAAEMRHVEHDLAAQGERLVVVRAELAQLAQRDHPVTAGMTIAHYSERFFALRRELRDLVGGEGGDTA